MKDYNPESEQPMTEPQGEAAETTDNLFTIPPLAERDPESVEDDSISGWMLYMYVCIGLGAFLSLLSLKEPGVTPIFRYAVWINLAFAVYVIVAAYKRMRNAVFLAKTYVWVSLLTNAFMVLRGALVTPVGSGLNTFTALSAVISAAWLYFLYKSSAIEARFPRNMRRAFVWDWVAILVAYVIPFFVIAIQSYRTTDAIEYTENAPDPQAIKKLKSEIAKLKNQCPTTRNCTEIYSVDYSEESNIVSMRVSTPLPVKDTKRYKKLAKDYIMASYMCSSDKTILKTLAAARASLKLTMSSFTNMKNITIELTPEDFDSMCRDGNEKELCVRLLKASARVENEGCPYNLDSDVTMLSAATDDGRLVYTYKYSSSYAPEEKYVWDNARAAMKSENKRDLVNDLASDVLTAQLTSVINTAGYGLRYVYTSENGKYTATIEISPEEFGELYESILRAK